jgi:hypothetical protein
MYMRVHNRGVCNATFRHLRDTEDRTISNGVGSGDHVSSKNTPLVGFGATNGLSDFISKMVDSVSTGRL